MEPYDFTLAPVLKLISQTNEIDVKASHKSGCTEQEFPAIALVCNRSLSGKNSASKQNCCSLTG